MPHDKNGNKLEVGNRVLIEAEVKTITMSEDYCNLTVETVEVMYPGSNRNMVTLNAKQVVKK